MKAIDKHCRQNVKSLEINHRILSPSQTSDSINAFTPAALLNRYWRIEKVIDADARCLRLGLDPLSTTAEDFCDLWPGLLMDQPLSLLTVGLGPKILNLRWYLWHQMSWTITNPEEKGKVEDWFPNR